MNSETKLAVLLEFQNDLAPETFHSIKVIPTNNLCCKRDYHTEASVSLSSMQLQQIWNDSDDCGKLLQKANFWTDLKICYLGHQSYKHNKPRNDLTTSQRIKFLTYYISLALVVGRGHKESRNELTTSRSKEFILSASKIGAWHTKSQTPNTKQQAIT